MLELRESRRVGKQVEERRRIGLSGPVEIRIVAFSRLERVVHVSLEDQPVDFDRRPPAPRRGPARDPRRSPRRAAGSTHSSSPSPNGSLPSTQSVSRSSTLANVSSYVPGRLILGERRLAQCPAVVKQSRPTGGQVDLATIRDAAFDELEPHAARWLRAPSVATKGSGRPPSAAETRGGPLAGATFDPLAARRCCTS